MRRVHQVTLDEAIKNKKHGFTGRRVAKKPRPRAGICRVCGCTDHQACIGGDPWGRCYWLDSTKTLCSACGPKARAA